MPHSDATGSATAQSEEYAYEEETDVLQETISRLQLQLDQLLTENNLLSGSNARLEDENACLKAELLSIKGTITASVATEVSKFTAIEIEKATSAISVQLAAKIDSLSQTVQSHSEHLANSRIMDRLALTSNT